MINRHIFGLRDSSLFWSNRSIEISRVLVRVLTKMKWDTLFPWITFLRKFNHVWALVGLLTLMLANTPVAWIIYENHIGNLTAFPHDIPYDVNRIDIRHSQISAIDKIGPFPWLQTFIFSNMSLIQLPDFTNASDSLIYIDLSSNNIMTITSIRPMPSLNDLDLRWNYLAEMPDLSNISSSLEVLKLSENKIVRIESIPLPKMYKLKRFMLSYNQLYEFPDLTNVSSTLEELDLAHNNLETVGFLPYVRFLRIITLSENRLTEFPDLSNVGTTLQRLGLSKNYIRYIPERLMMSLKTLNFLDLRENPLLSLPGFCHLNTIKLLLSESSFNCSWKMAFSKVMESAGKILFPQTSPHCDLPANLANKDWTSITIMDLIDGGGKCDT